MAYRVLLSSLAHVNSGKGSTGSSSSQALDQIYRVDLANEKGDQYLKYAIFQLQGQLSKLNPPPTPQWSPQPAPSPSSVINWLRDGEEKGEGAATRVRGV